MNTKWAKVGSVAQTLLIFLLVPFGRTIQPFLSALNVVPLWMLGGIILCWFAFISIISRSAASLLALVVSLGAIAGCTMLLTPQFIEITHIALYGLLAFFFFYTRTGTGAGPICLTLIAANIVSLADELLQGLHPLRYFDLRDLIFNLLGSLSGLAVALFWRRQSPGEATTKASAPVFFP